MYAIHFLLFVMTLVLCHIIQSCLKPHAKDGETVEPPDESNKEEATTEEDEENCRWAPWSAWSRCTVTCGDGISIRHRVTLILGNCTGDMVQEKICLEQHCPHDKDFIFQRKDEDDDQSSKTDENMQKPEEIEQNHRYKQTHSDTKMENQDADEVPDSPGGHISGYNSAANGNFDPDNDVHAEEKDEQGDEVPRGRSRGQSWTSDDGNAWGHQSSFDSFSPEEDTAYEGFGGSGEAKMEDADKCFSDCSPTDPPADGFGSKGSSTKEDVEDGAKSGQDEDQRSFEETKRSGKAGEGQEESFAKGDGDSSEDKQKSKNKESLRDDGEISNDEDNQREADTDLDGDDDEIEDADDYDDHDGDDGSEAGKKQKREHEGEEEDIEQDDLEQEGEGIKKKRRRKKKRKRKRNHETRKNEKKSNDSRVACDPTELCDTFIAKFDNADSGDGIVSAVLGNENSDSCSRLTSEIKDCSSANSSKLEVLETDKCCSPNKSTPEPSG